MLWLGKKFLRWIAILIVAALICALYVYDYNNPIYTVGNYGNASELEQYQIENFYSTNPEMISYGELFDIKLTVAGSEGATVSCTIIKKTSRDFKFVVIPFIYSYGARQQVGYQNEKEWPRWYMFTNYMFDVKYLVSNVDIGLIPAGYRNEISLEIRYNNVSEIHTLTYDSNSAHELFLSTVKQHYELIYAHPEWNTASRTILRLYAGKYMRSILLNNFDLWEETMIMFIDQESKSNSEQKNIVCDIDLFYNIETNESLISSENVERYYEIKNTIRGTLCE